MSENSGPLTDQIAPPTISHRRILYEMAGVVIFGSLAGFALFSGKVGFGIFVGGILAFANYFWQQHSLKAIFDRTIGGERPRFLAARYILRYVVIVAAVAVIYVTDTVSIYAVVFGLASFSMAVVIEGLKSIFIR